MRYKIHSVKYPGIPPKETGERLYLYYWEVCFNSVLPEETIIIKDFYYNNKKHCLNAPAHRSLNKNKITWIYICKDHITNLSGPAKILFDKQKEYNHIISEQYFVDGEYFEDKEKWAYKVEQQNANLWKNIII